MEKFWQWIVVSSADPTQVSATVKALIVGVIPMVMFLSQSLHLHILPEQLQGLAELIRQTVEVALGVIASVMFLFGLLRKLANGIRDLWLSWKQKGQ